MAAVRQSVYANRGGTVETECSNSSDGCALKHPTYLQAKLNAEHCPIPTIFITAHGDEKLRLQAMRGGAVKFLAKPFDGAILLESVRVALELEG